jgi:hypothetical protein
VSARRIFSRAAFTLYGLLFWLGSGSEARPLHSRDECFQGRGRVVRTVRSVKVRITPGVDKDSLNEPICRLVVSDLNGNVILSETDSSFEVLLDNKDINGDGIPDLVLLGFSGGSHCCWTYYFLSLGAKPALIAKFENQRDATFLTDERTGRIFIEIEDGAFDYFDEACHACSPLPVVYLRLDGTNWVDIGSQRFGDYDEIIKISEKALTGEDRRRLKTLRQNPSDAAPVSDARSHALMIVFAYLYSGREEKAHQALRDLWPAFDQERMWKLIEETRRGGILCYTRKEAACGSDNDNK